MRIKCLETGEIYESIREAAEETGICRKSIELVINGKSQRAQGYSWRPVRTGKPKKVKCVETGQVFDSINQAEILHKNHHIGDCCRGTRNRAAGMSWKFIND